MRLSKKEDLDYYKDIYEKADLIFHDCETMNASTVHTHYDFLNKFPSKIKSKMWLYHYQDDKDQDAVADGFAGFVKRGQEFNYARE